MSQDYSKSIVDSNGGFVDKPIKHNWWMLLVLPAWVTVCFFAAQILIEGVVWLMVAANIPLKSVNSVVLETILASVIYIIIIFLVIIAPRLFKKAQTTWPEIGITRLPKWSDILLAPAGLVIYVIASSLLILMATKILPGVDVNQVQSTGFGQLSQQYEYILAFSTLVVIAPIAEEVIFRGYLFGKLKKYVPLWLAILVTSILFGLLHLFNSGAIAWNLAMDTFALSVVLCLLRVVTGNIWSSILLHIIKNGIAFYILFINPTLFTTLLR